MTPDAPFSGARIWRQSLGMRIGVIALAVMATGISIPAAVASALSVVVAAAIPVLVVAAAVFIGVRSWGVSLALTRESVRVRDLLRTYSIPLAQVARARFTQCCR